MKNWMIPAGCGLLLALALPAASAAASRPAGTPLRAAVTGRLVAAPDGAGEAELVEIAATVVPSLLKLPSGSSRVVADWPVTPGAREEIELTRFEIYAPDARIVKIEGREAIELPRSRRAFFRGRSVDDPETRLMITVDPDTGGLEAVAYGREGTHELKPSGGGGYLVAAAEAFQTQAQQPAWSCGQELDPLAQGGAFPFNTAVNTTGAAPAAGAGDVAVAVSLRTASIAVDTDNELMQLKFGNNVTAATNYIASLFALMNVMYERDVQVRLLQGFTILRPSTTPDPYVQSSPAAANGNSLNEFTSYWSAGCGGACSGVSRALAMMLSGKQSSDFSASGIAWLDSAVQRIARLQLQPGLQVRPGHLGQRRPARGARARPQFRLAAHTLLCATDRYLLQWRSLLHWFKKLSGSGHDQRRDECHGDGYELLPPDGMRLDSGLSPAHRRSHRAENPGAHRSVHFSTRSGKRRFQRRF